MTGRVTSVSTIGACPNIVVSALRAAGFGVVGAGGAAHLTVCFPRDFPLGDLTRCIRCAADRGRVIVVAERRWPHAVAAIEAGADVYLVWEDAHTAQTVTRVATALAATGPGPAACDSALAKLSHREREALAYIAAGYTHQQTARRMCVSKATVDTFVARMKVKLGVNTKAALTRIALSEPHHRKALPRNG